MRRAWLRNAFLAAAVAALGAVRLPQAGAGVRPSTRSPLRRPEAARIDPRRASRDGAHRAREARRGMVPDVAPRRARRRRCRSQRLLAIAEARSPARLAATDLARFELERPAARLTIDAQSFDFGIVNEVSREQYVLTGDTVYTRKSALRRGAARRVPATSSPGSCSGTNEVPARIELDTSSPSRSEDGKWVLDAGGRRPEPGRSPALGGRLAPGERAARRAVHARARPWRK